MSLFTVALLVIPALVPADPDASPRAGRDAPSASAQEPPVLNLRANRVNRCVDARGRVVLQDLPCLPDASASGPVAAARPASGAASEVIDLAALPPRVRAELPAAGAQVPARDASQALITGSWKLALLLAVGYGLWRLWLRVRDRLDSAPAPAATPRARRRTPTTVVAAGEVLDFELQPRRRSGPTDGGGGDARQP